jgi:hypothetical protein
VGQHGKSLLKVQYNRTAAMPSLHAAFPLLSALYLRKSIGRRGWLMLGYGGIMWFAAVYLAEHWIIGVVAGLACTIIAYAAVESVATYLAGRRAETRMAPRSVPVEAPEPRVRPEPGSK